jgi:hypothetical protein
MTLVPHPSVCYRPRISRPTDQYNEDKFPVDGKGGPGLSTADAGFELLEEFRVAGGQLEGIFHYRQHSLDIALTRIRGRW